MYSTDEVRELFGSKAFNFRFAFPVEIISYKSRQAVPPYKEWNMKNTVSKQLACLRREFRENLKRQKDQGYTLRALRGKVAQAERRSTFHLIRGK